MSEPVSIQMPNGQVIQVGATGDAGRSPGGPRDVSLPAGALQVLALPDFVPTVEAVLATVRMAVAASRPDSVTAEFGVELAVKTGKAISLVAEGGGKAHVKITATWGWATAAAGVEVQEVAEGDAEGGTPTPHRE